MHHEPLSFLQGLEHELELSLVGHTEKQGDFFMHEVLVCDLLNFVQIPKFHDFLAALKAVREYGQLGERAIGF